MTNFKNGQKPHRSAGTAGTASAPLLRSRNCAKMPAIWQKFEKYGWEYIVCDIQWYEPKAKDNDYNNFTELCMDEYGRLIPAPNRFPSSEGKKALSQLPTIFTLSVLSSEYI